MHAFHDGGELSKSRGAAFVRSRRGYKQSKESDRDTPFTHGLAWIGLPIALLHFVLLLQRQLGHGRYL